VDQLDTYARAAARLARLEVDEAWWPGVLRHLAVLCDNAALVEAAELAPLEPGLGVEAVGLAPLEPGLGAVAADRAASS
jgi:hypothetical protein